MLGPIFDFKSNLSSGIGLDLPLPRRRAPGQKDLDRRSSITPRGFSHTRDITQSLATHAQV